MTDRIKDLASQYAKYKSPIAEYIRAYDKRDNLNEAYRIEAERVLNFLSSRYCLVEKEIIRKEYEEAKSTYDLYTSATCINNMESRAIDHSQGRIYELTTLFGKELFTDTEQ